MCCFIVPPALLQRAARSADAQTREAAVRTLLIDHSLRQRRAVRARELVAAGLLSGSAGHGSRAGAGSGAGGHLEREIFDARHAADTEATDLVRAEGQPAVADVSVDEAYDGLGATYALYWQQYQRDSIDDAGMPLLGEVHFETGYDNAFWDGRRMIFGDGDGKAFVAGGFTRAIDVIGHELTHGITEHTIGLRYEDQPGALNESISDVFGSLVKQFKLGQTAAEADWLIGAGILGPELNGVALRSMKAPGTAFEGDDQPADMSGYVSTFMDNGGVHTNSGIPNHAFYLFATALGGRAWEKAGLVWYSVLVGRAVTPSASFRAFALATVAAAQRLYGHSSVESKAAAEAWAQVGVLRAGG